MTSHDVEARMLFAGWRNMTTACYSEKKVVSQTELSFRM